MKLEKIGSTCFFASPTAVPVKAGGALSVVFGGEGHLVLNREHTLSLKDGVFPIPVSLLKEGENTLSLSTKEGALSSEGLTLRDGVVSPSGISPEALLPALFKELRRLDRALASQAQDITLLKEKTKERALFS